MIGPTDRPYHNRTICAEQKCSAILFRDRQLSCRVRLWYDRTAIHGSILKIENDNLDPDCKVAISSHIKDSSQTSLILLDYKSVEFRKVGTVCYAPHFLKQGKHFGQEAKGTSRLSLGDYEGSCSQVLRENLTPELSYGSELKSAVLHKTLQHTRFLRVTIALEQAHFLCDVRRPFESGTNECPENQFLSFVAGGHAVKDEDFLRLLCVSVRRVFLLVVRRDRIRTKMEIKSVGHVELTIAPRSTALFRLRLLRRFLASTARRVISSELFGAKFQSVGKFVYC